MPEVKSPMLFKIVSQRISIVHAKPDSVELAEESEALLELLEPLEEFCVAAFSDVVPELTASCWAFPRSVARSSTIFCKSSAEYTQLAPTSRYALID